MHHQSTLKINADNDLTTLHRAVEYWNSSELSLSFSQNFGTKYLQIFLLWIFDDQMFLTSSNLYIETIGTQRIRKYYLL